jgi:nucleoside 2-deoxyribosyltransferase
VEHYKKPCPICKLPEQTVESRRLSDQTIYNCSRCGHFIITGTAEAIADKKPIYTKLSAWIRDRNEKGANIPEINSNSLEEIPASLPDYSPSEKQLILLRNIERKTVYPGDRVTLDSYCDTPLAWASEPTELSYYLKSLVGRGLLVRMSAANDYMITYDGWDYLEEKASQVEERTQVFVAMSFSDIMKPAWEHALRDAITEAGYKPYRIDVEPHIDRIDAKIIMEIKNSRFLVADVTEQKHGVYFEAGYALGMGLPVIWCVRKDDLGNVHFDTRQYNHIVWESEEQLKEQLYNLICAVVGRGPTTP